MVDKIWWGMWVARVVFLSVFGFYCWFYGVERWLGELIIIFVYGIIPPHH